LNASCRAKKTAEIALHRRIKILFD